MQKQNTQCADHYDSFAINVEITDKRHTSGYGRKCKYMSTKCKTERCQMLCAFCG